MVLLTSLSRGYSLKANILLNINIALLYYGVLALGNENRLHVHIW